MGSCCASDEEDECFFDTREDISSFSDCASDCAAADTACSSSSSGGFGYEIWVQNLDSVRERRGKFLRMMGLDGMGGVEESIGFPVDMDRLTGSSGAVLRSSCFIEEFSSSRSSSSSNWSNDGHSFSEDGFPEENFRCRFRNLDDGTEFVVDEWEEDGNLRRLRQLGSNRLYTMEEFQRSLGLSPLVQRFMQREAAGGSDSDGSVVRRRTKKGWLKKLGVVTCAVDRQKGDQEGDTKDGVSSVRVRTSKKHHKELSALCMGQEIEAHVGPILTMKFSLDGKYLASAGEDGVVRVWQVVDSKSGVQHIPRDQNGVYFKLNKSSELTPFYMDKEKIEEGKKTKRSAQSPCAILPQTVFHLSDKPIHEFYGHNDDVLDLSWSSSQYLLSSSVDKTVRLWKVGSNDCLKVFSHNNYVTCVQFNPVDENFFISGSIDGKVRVWDTKGGLVVDWTDVRDIVTAVCYRPDGQGGIVGSMTGNCRFYSVSGNRLVLDAVICLQGKKKLCSRITGFQYSPTDPEKIMVTSADSQIRILDGHEIVSKYKGLRNAGSQISASFSSDGRHIISASEDSNVYVWNYNSLDGPKANQPKSIWSCERFFSTHVSVAIAWPGSTSQTSVSIPPRTLESCNLIFRGVASNRGNDCRCHLEFSCNGSSDRFSLNRGFFSELTPKVSATWPEEKLPTANRPTLPSSDCKAHYYKFLKASYQNITSSHAWGMVIVTAGWDGRIRTFLNYGLPLRL